MRASLTVIFALCIAHVSAKIQWEATYTEEIYRRLKIDTATSVNNTADASCIVGGYDTTKPTRVYVGGPCSAINTTGPTASFRWIEMETVDGALEKDGKLYDLDSFGTGTVHSMQKTTHVEVGVTGSLKFKDTTIGHAAIFGSTTSYLAQKAVEFNENEFVIGKTGNTYDTIKMCVEKCCPTPGAAGCACKDSKCPTTKIKAAVGDFKYSLLVASYDNSGTGYTAGAAGNGWEKVVATYGNGTGTSKALTGNFVVFQGIDFTNLQSETLTIVGGGKSTLYKDMVACDMTKYTSCTMYPVTSVVAVAAGWSGNYAFPQTYNLGSWKQNLATTGSKPTTTPEKTKQVAISAVKPSAADLVSVKIATSTADAAKKKVVFLKYTFDISGVTAKHTAGTESSGKYFVYDPTVKSGTGEKVGAISAAHAVVVPSMMIILTAVMALV